MAFSEDLAGFVIGLLLYNFTAFVSSPMSSYVSSHRGKMSVGRALTLTSGFYSVGMIAGPQIGGLIGNQLGLSMVYKIAFAIFSVSVLVILFIRPNSLEKEQHEHEPNASIKRNRLFLMLLPLLGLITFVNFMPQTFSPNYLQNQQNLDLAAIGGLGSLGSLSNAVFMLALGNLRPAFGLLLGQALVGCFTLLLLFGNDLAWFQLGYLLLGSTRLGRSMALAFARRFIRADETGLAFGLIETLNGAALFLASALAGLLYARATQLHLFHRADPGGRFHRGQRGDAALAFTQAYPTGASMTLSIVTFTLGPLENNTFLIADEASGLAAVVDPRLKANWWWQKRRSAAGS